LIRRLITLANDQHQQLMKMKMMMMMIKDALCRKRTLFIVLGADNGYLDFRFPFIAQEHVRDRTARSSDCVGAIVLAL